jgi:transcriptional regulator with XRE-family HTH domain
MTAFGDQLKKLREAQNITISTLSEMTGISRPTIYAWENGKRVPQSFTTRKLLADIFKVPPYYFDAAIDDLCENPLIKDIISRVERLERINKNKQ